MENYKKRNKKIMNNKNIDEQERIDKLYVLNTEIKEDRTMNKEEKQDLEIKICNKILKLRKDKEQKEEEEKQKKKIREDIETEKARRKQEIIKRREKEIQQQTTENTKTLTTLKKKIVIDNSKKEEIKTKDKIFNKDVTDLSKRKKLRGYTTGIICHHITIKPTQCDIKTLEKIKECIEKTKNTPNILFYVYEQRGQTKETKGEGAHLHALIAHVSTENGQGVRTLITRAVQKINKTFKCINNKECIKDVKIINDSQLKQVIRYLKGFKRPNKLPACEINKEWRKENAYEDWYNLDTEYKIIPEEEEDEEIKYEKSNCIVSTCGERKTVIVVIDSVKHIFEVK